MTSLPGVTFGVLNTAALRQQALADAARDARAAAQVLADTLQVTVVRLHSLSVTGNPGHSVFIQGIEDVESPSPFVEPGQVTVVAGVVASFVIE